MKTKNLITLIFGLILISILSLQVISAFDSTPEKDFYKNKFQKINTNYVDFELPTTATHYWNGKGLDTYEIIISNLSFKGYTDKILRITWQDERYSVDTIRINYTVVNGILSIGNIEPYSIKKNSNLKFNNFSVEIGNYLGENYKSVNNFTDIINISYPIYSWNKWSDIDLTKINPLASTLSFTAIDDVNIDICGTLNTENEIYNLNQSLNTTVSCFVIEANNVTLNFNGFNITGNGSGEGDTGIINTNYNKTTIKNGFIYDFYIGIHFATSRNNNIIGITESGNDVGIYFDKSYNNNVTNSSISLSTIYDVYLQFSSNSTFLNAIYDVEYVNLAGDSLIRKWYYKVYVNDTNGDNVNNANITIYNSTGDYQFTLTTDNTGFTQSGEIIDYITISNPQYYYSPYNITAISLNNTPSLLSHTFNSSLGNNYKDVFTFYAPLPPLPPTVLQTSCLNIVSGFSISMGMIPILIVIMFAVIVIGMMTSGLDFELGKKLSKFQFQDISKFILGVVVVGLIVVVGIILISNIGGC